MALNTRLAPAEIAYILDHSEAYVVIVYAACRDVLTEALKHSTSRQTAVIHSGQPHDEDGYEHTNGWCSPWSVTAAGAAHHCLRKVNPPDLWRARFRCTRSSEGRRPCRHCSPG
ncbi:hypothetical protein [Streptomyces sp. NPDC053560]|uniref:hypothetical protein n=1 Tax=Streptomyces sp. NPDC053560 TaxID=3365711 RepID=UPI0037D7E8BD